MILLLLVLLWPASIARAQGDIHRCVGADGTPVFTDRVCSDLNATPVLPAPTASVPAPAGIPPAPPAVLCAAGVEQLKQAVIDAFAQRNPNRLAGLALWNGDGKATVVADIQFFSRLMSRSLIDVKTQAGADDGDKADASSPAHGEILIVQTASNEDDNAPEETRFGIVHRSGCVWLRP